MEEIKTEFVEDDIREGQIKHWEVQLNHSLHAVYVAQQTLEKLYRARYREIGRTAIEQTEPKPDVDPGSAP